MECQLGRMLEKFRYWVRDWPEQLVTLIGPEGVPLCDRPVAHEILERTRLEQFCQKDRQKYYTREASAVNPVGGGRLQVHKKGWQRRQERPFDNFGGISGTFRLGLEQENLMDIHW